MSIRGNMNTEAMRPLQHDAHVRNRKGIVRQIVDRWYEWNGGSTSLGMRRLRALPEGSRDAALHAAAAQALSAYRWPRNWGTKFSAYSAFGAPQIPVGTYRTVPARVVHAIMCDVEIKGTPQLER